MQCSTLLGRMQEGVLFGGVRYSALTLGKRLGEFLSALTDATTQRLVAYLSQSE